MISSPADVRLAYLLLSLGRQMFFFESVRFTGVLRVRRRKFDEVGLAMTFILTSQWRSYI